MTRGQLSATQKRVLTRTVSCWCSDLKLPATRTVQPSQALNQMREEQADRGQNIPFIMRKVEKHGSGSLSQEACGQTSPKAGMPNSSPPESPPGALTPSLWREIRNEIRVWGYFRKKASLWKLEEPERSARMFSLVLRIKWDNAHSECPTHGECSVNISYYYDVLLTVIITVSRNLVIFKIHIKC